MFHNAIRTERDRKISYQFMGPVADVDDAAEGEVWHDAIEIVFTHNKQEKHYTADVYRIQVGKRDGYSMKRFAMMQGDSARICSQPAARFSDSSFAKFCIDAMNTAHSLVSAGDSSSRATSLVCYANSYAGLSERVALATN